MHLAAVLPCNAYNIHTRITCTCIEMHVRRADPANTPGKTASQPGTCYY